jgi:hypothetical protein
MKNISKFVFLSLLLTALVWSCSKDENKIYFDGGTAPVLTSNKTAISLSFLTKAKEAVTFSWTNPNYQFTTGISSQNVSYVLQIDTTGANFTNPNKKEVALSTDLSFSIPDSTFNDYLLSTMALVPAKSHNLDVRIISTLTNSSVPLYSNVLKYSVTPYAIPPKVVPPGTAPNYLDGKLYITGDATAKGWMGGGDAEVLSQKFTQKSTTVYEIIVPLIGGKSYTFVPIYGDWTNKYSIATKNDPAEVNGGTFQLGGNDILAPAASGTYKITVDFQRGIFTVVLQ